MGAGVYVGVCVCAGVYVSVCVGTCAGVAACADAVALLRLKLGQGRHDNGQALLSLTAKGRLNICKRKGVKKQRLLKLRAHVSIYRYFNEKFISSCSVA